MIVNDNHLQQKKKPVCDCSEKLETELLRREIPKWRRCVACRSFQGTYKKRIELRKRVLQDAYEEEREERFFDTKP